MTSQRTSVRVRLATSVLGAAAALAVADRALFAQEVDKKTPAAPAEKAQPPERNPSSLDEKLLDNLGDGLLDGLDELPLPERGAKDPAGGDKPRGAKGREPSPLDRKLERSLEGDGEDIGSPGESDPLVEISRKMRAAEARLNELKTEDDTQRLQDEVIADLGKLLEALKKQQQQQQPSGGSSSPRESAGSSRRQVKQPKQSAAGQGQSNSRPSPDSTARVGKDEQKPVDMGAMRELLKDLWGALPEREREQMLQDPVEQFLPKYDLLIERYFRRLAEEGDKRK